MDTELEKISKICMNTTDFEALTGNIVRDLVAAAMKYPLMTETGPVIGLTELRAALNFGPLPPWRHRNLTRPSEQELSSASSLEEYYDLKEPTSKMRSLDSWWLLEKNMAPAVVYFDEHFPAIRKIFRGKFKKIREEGGKKDRKMVDRMIEEYSAIKEKVYKAMDKILNNFECET
ncbi:hypothetical protein GCK72_007836 [Caenorhabditis remanei]|uniref:Uncharacterized protein n=1 Tax=Caenorhabditis remanei TaxID=31234 RepID=A0A6A5HNH3_CAERE|nr:hypothetical protein GCK72_007836 [Caenorhabditis remanei]KAF1767877.1 hypothetical protein GCK72_007836 [Caenorhabditis remanei]